MEMDKLHPAREASAVRRHYDIERALAAKLRSAPLTERGRLYRELYDELFSQIPDHPQLTRKASPDETRRYVDQLLAIVGRYLNPSSIFLEIGPGDCALSAAVAARVQHVYAVDVSSEITRRVLPANCQLVLSDGTSIPVAGATLAFSNQLMEHLHPDDARAQLENVYAALAPGGRYLCITPNALCGPHDISAGFDDLRDGVSPPRVHIS